MDKEIVFRKMLVAKLECIGGRNLAHQAAFLTTKQLQELVERYGN